MEGDINDETPVTDADGNILVKIVISSEDGSSGIAYVMPSDAEKILSGELDVTYDSNNQIILLPRNEVIEVSEMTIEESVPQESHRSQSHEIESMKKENLINSSFLMQHPSSGAGLSGISSSSGYWRPTVLQDEHIEEIKRACSALCSKKNFLDVHQSRKDALLDQFSSGKLVSQPASHHEMISLLDFSPIEAVEGSERFSLLRKHSMIFRVGPNSKVLTMQEQAVNEAAVRICCLCPSLIFHKRELAMHAKQALREAELDFTGTRSAGGASYLHAGGVGGAGGQEGGASGSLTQTDMANHLLNLPRVSGGIRGGNDDFVGGNSRFQDTGDERATQPRKFVLSSVDVSAIREAANRLLPEIPEVSIKAREECSLVENYVFSDVIKLMQMDEDSLDQQMDSLREISSVYGRYNSGPINPSASLSHFEVTVNEAAAWLVRKRPQLLSHFTLLSEWAKRVALKSGVPTSTAAATSSRTSKTPVGRSRSDFYGSSGDNMRYGLQSSVGADLYGSGDFGASADYGHSSGLLGASDDIRGLNDDYLVVHENQMIDYGGHTRSGIGLIDMDFIDQECILNMTCDEDELELNVDEILRIARVTSLADVRVIRAPCQGYSKINVADLCECIHLRELNLEENSLRHFPPRLHLPRLTSLGLSGNRFTQIPLIEQFPRLRHLTIDVQFFQRLDPRLLAYFCPHLKTINGEYFRSNVPDFTLRIIQDDYLAFESSIRSKWEAEYSDRFDAAKARDERIAVLEDLVRELKRKKPIDDNIDSHKDILLLRFIDEFVRVKLGDKDFEIMLGGPLSSGKSVICMDRGASAGVGSKTEQGNEPAVLEEDEEVEREDKAEDQRIEGERALFHTAEEMLGYHMPPTANVMDNHLTYLGFEGAEADGLFQAGASTPPGSQMAAPQLHIGRSLRQGRSIVMSLVQPKAVHGRPTAEFLPGELRNKDYVKGHVASEIYKKTVKDQLGHKYPSKKHNLNRPARNKMLLSGGSFANINTSKVPLHEVTGNQVGGGGGGGGYSNASLPPGLASQGNIDILADVTARKRGRPKGDSSLSGIVDLPEDDISSEYMLMPTTLPGGGPITPPRPKLRRPGGIHQRSLKDLCTTSGINNKSYLIDYDPLHFIRCHARENDTRDYETKVWRCAFEPNPNNPEETTHIVATCGGECVCLINCETGKVMKRFKHADEEFTCLAWTTVESETGQKSNLLAAAGLLQDIRLLHPEQLMCYAEMKGHTDDVTAMFFHQSNPTILFSGDSKAAILVWDIGVPQGGGADYKTRHSLMMRLRCPRLDVNPVLNLVFMPHYDYLIAGCEDGMFAWKLSEFRSEKREKEPDMELRVMTENEINLDGLAQLSENALVMKGIERGSIQVFDFASVLERRKGLQKLVPVDVRGRLEWAQTDEIYISVSVRQSMGAVLCGDNVGSIWIYDLDPHLSELQSSARNRFEVKPIKILEWPECSMYGAEQQQLDDGKAGGFNSGLMDNFQQNQQQNTGFRPPVINAVDMSSDGHFVVAVTDNNLVCIWRYAPQSAVQQIHNNNGIVE